MPFIWDSIQSAAAAIPGVPTPLPVRAGSASHVTSALARAPSKEGSGGVGMGRAVLQAESASAESEMATIGRSIGRL